MKKGILLFPIQLALRSGGTAIKIIVFLLGFAFKTSGFLVRRFFVLIAGAVIGVFLEKKYMSRKEHSAKKP